MTYRKYCPNFTSCGLGVKPEYFKQYCLSENTDAEWADCPTYQEWRKQFNKIRSYKYRHKEPIL